MVFKHFQAKQQFEEDLFNLKCFKCLQYKTKFEVFSKNLDFQFKTLERLQTLFLLKVKEKEKSVSNNAYQNPAVVAEWWLGGRALAS